MKHPWVLMLCLLVACQQPTKKVSLNDQLGKAKWVDLTYSFSDSTLYWPNNPTGFQLDTQFNGTTAAGFYYSSNVFSSPEHGGTHLDAPVHFAKGKWSNDEIPLERLTGEAVVIDVKDKTTGNADFQITTPDVVNWEKKYGNIPDNSILLFRTGWGKFYPNAEKYLGTAEKGEAAVPKLHFPSIHPALALWLVQNRTIKAIGIDCASVDYGQSTEFKTHRVLYEQNIPGFENVANMDKLPVKGAYIIALPMKVKGGSGGPLRIVAVLTEEN